MADESFFDVLTALAQGTSQVSNDVLAVLFSEDLVEKSSWLLVVVIWMLVRVSSD